MRKLVGLAVAAAFGLLAIVARVGVTPPIARAAATCSGDRAPAVADTTMLQTGASIAAEDGGALVMFVGDRATRSVAADGIAGAIRHVSSTPGVGTAYVRDRAGGDVVIATTATGIHAFPAHGEALHPSLGTDGTLVWAQGAGLRLVPAGSARIQKIPGPMRGGLTFSPRSDPDGTIVAGVVAPPTRAVPDDERVSNLWAYDDVSRRWRQVTRFPAGADRWSVVRTPFVAPDGSVEFVRVHGRASADRAPVFELWQVRGARVSEVRSLPGELYLAGFDGSTRLWNLRDGETGSWRIDREQADGSLVPIGCGAVAVDPLDRPDPDRRSSSRTSATVDGTPTSAPDVDQILVGDFSSSDTASDAAARISSVFGAPATVIDASQAPAVVRPGVWAVLVPVASGDPEAVLARFRDEFPDLADWSWIVST